MFISGTELVKLFNAKSQHIVNYRNRYKLVEGNDTFRLGKNRFFKPEGMRKILENKQYKFDRQIVSVANLKGGVGKTTIAVHLALKAASLGFKTLLIDADKQANATTKLVNDENVRYVLHDIVKKQCAFKDAIVTINDYLSVLPSNLKNQMLENEILSNQINKVNYFRRHLDRLTYEFIVIDTEPNLSQINFMSITSSDLNIAPVKLDNDSLDGLELMLNFIDEAKKEWPELQVKTKALINCFDGRMTTSLKKINELQAMGIEVFETLYRTDNSFVRFQDGTELPRNSKAYEDVSNFTFELLKLNQLAVNTTIQ